ncbi:hypothetical protein [Paraburkholderia sp.]|uniref:hypothetical protein n=1 Tax=Paraburkholderia sp. TaxID=1926495 RepID=UPI0039E69A4C
MRNTEARHRRGTVHRQLMLVLLLSPSLASANCTCEFSGDEYKAFGTRAACNVVMSDNDKTCNIAFAAVGASTPVLSSVVTSSVANYQQQAYEITIQYLQLVSKNDDAGLTNPKFLQPALLAFMRAAYLRPGVTDDLKGLDAAVSQFTKEQVDKISEVFYGKRNAFDGRQGNLTYSVNRTTVRLTYQVTGKNKVTIETTYMPVPEK